MIHPDIFPLLDEEGRLYSPIRQAATLAKYSRSPESARILIKQTPELKAQKFQQRVIVDYGHSCYDDQTEVLTESGFVFWKDLKPGVALATLSPTGELEYLEPVRLVRDRYVGQMYQVRAQRVDLLVTPNHKMLVWIKKSPRQRATLTYSLVEASEIQGVPVAYRLNAERWEGQNPPSIRGKNGMPDVDTVAFLAFLGFFIGDGSFPSKANKSAVSFRLRKKRKIDYLYELCACLGFEVLRHANDKFYVEVGEYARWTDACYSVERHKQIPVNVLGFGQEGLRGLFEGLLHSDGYTDQNGHVAYDTTSPILKDQLYVLALKLGWSAYASDPREPKSQNHKPLWRVHFNQTKNCPEVNKVKYRPQDAWVEYDGEVFCAEMPRNHTLYVRRNRRAVWSGNSVAELATLPVCFEGVSIVASKVLEAWPRPGCSEKSTRMQRFTRDQMCWPSFDLQAGFELFVGKLFDLYDEVLDWAIETNPSGVEGTNTSHRAVQSNIEKAAFDIARCILPAGVKTNLTLVAYPRDLAKMIRTLLGSDNAELIVIGAMMQKSLEEIGGPLIRHTDPEPWFQQWAVRYVGTEDWEPGVPRAEMTSHTVLSASRFRDLVKRLYGMQWHEFYTAMDARPVKAEVPDVFRFYRAGFDVLIDYGAMRDLQRHRRMYQYVEPLTTRYGYVVPDALIGTPWEGKFRKLMDYADDVISESEVPILIKQYVVPMCFLHRSFYDMDFQQLYYLTELRTQPEGHISYKRIAWQMVEAAMQIVPEAMQWCRAICPDP